MNELAVDGAVRHADILAWLWLVRPAVVYVLQDPNHGAAVLYRVSGGAVVVEAIGVGGYWHGAVRVADWSGTAVCSTTRLGLIRSHSLNCCSNFL